MGNGASGVQDNAQKNDELAFLHEKVERLSSALIAANLIQPDSEETQEHPIDAAIIEIGRLGKQDDEIAGLKRQLAAQKGQTTKARNEAAAMAAELPSRPRSIEAPGHEPYDAGELVDLIEDADDVQILFSDGRQELAGIPPASISGKAWREENGRVILTAPSLEVTGGGTNVQQLVAYALMIDGEIVAVKDRPEPLSIRPGQKYQLANDVIF